MNRWTKMLLLAVLALTVFSMTTGADASAGYCGYHHHFYGCSPYVTTYYAPAYIYSDYYVYPAYGYGAFYGGYCGW